MSSARSQSPQFHFMNIGPIKKAAFGLGDLTIIAGRNNTGKTSLVYALYGFLKWWQSPQGLRTLLSQKQDERLFRFDVRSVASDVLAKGHVQCPFDGKSLRKTRQALIRSLTQDFSKQRLPSVFGTRTNAFENSSCSVALGEYPLSVNASSPLVTQNGRYALQYDGKSMVVIREGAPRKALGEHSAEEDFYVLFQRFLLPEIALDPFTVSAERLCISLFSQELNLTRERLEDRVRKGRNGKSAAYDGPLLDEDARRYALPIKDHIDFVQNIHKVEKKKSSIYEEKLFNDIRDMMGGYFKNFEDGVAFWSTARKERKFQIPLHLASPSARGLVDLYFFLRHAAQENHLLIVEEPENHLDTANQIRLARLLRRIARTGVKVLVTTHSDYLIKEINNLVMLYNIVDDDWAEVSQRFGYAVSDALPPHAIRAYTTENGGLQECLVDNYGIDMPVFDEVIDDINRTASHLGSSVIVKEAQSKEKQ